MGTALRTTRDILLLTFFIDALLAVICLFIDAVTKSTTASDAFVQMLPSFVVGHLIGGVLIFFFEWRKND